jgi:peptidoglycan/xylan/chitin deacetylase (PgdA/CDA1 family)
VSLWASLPKPLQRRMARWCGQNKHAIQPAVPLISFTFDDFPRSALVQGGAVLSEIGFRATYYACFGLMDQSSPTGTLFSPSDFPALMQHEIGSHTFDHCDAWGTEPAEFEASIVRNEQFVARELPGVTMASLSYPISYPRPETKRRTAGHYECARGGGQTYNAGATDLNYLKAFFLEQSRDDLDSIKRAVDDNSRAGGWLILATHDICESPTRFGCTPGFFKQVVAYVAQSGAVVLPVSEAFARIHPAPVSLSLGTQRPALNAGDETGREALKAR